VRAVLDPNVLISGLLSRTGAGDEDLLALADNVPVLTPRSFVDGL
jgi:predicted nucleic acid-binding protein